MFIDATGIIIADDKRVHLSELSRPRALAAVPFAGRYRIIDFMISNMTNSGITMAGVATLNKYKSLMDHLGTGSAWDLDRKNQGLHILPPYLTSENYYNENDDLKGLLDFLRASRNEYVIIAASSVIMTTDFQEFADAHKASTADITVMYNEDGVTNGVTDIILETDSKMRVIDVFTNPEKPSSNKNSLGVIIMSKNLMIDLLGEAISKGIPNLSTELILRRYETLHIQAYEYKEPVLRVNSIQTYFQASMKVLDPKINEALFWSEFPVYTKVKDEAPAYIKEGSLVKNALISDGCQVYGDLDNSVVFRGVKIGKNSKIRNSIIFQGSNIGDGVELDHVILDKDVVIRDHTKLMGNSEYPVVIGKGAII